MSICSLGDINVDINEIELMRWILKLNLLETGIFLSKTSGGMFMFKLKIEKGY